MLLPSRLQARLSRSESGSDPAPAPAERTPRAAAARRALLDEIAGFMMRHELAITGANLALVCEGLSGAQPDLAGAFAQAEIAGLAMDQAWLDKLAKARTAKAEPPAGLDLLMDRIEEALSGFADVAQRAQDDTSQQRGRLGLQLEAITEAGQRTMIEGAGLKLFIELSQAMLARFAEVEAAMQRSHAETARLRSHLAEARAEAEIDHLTRLPNRRAFERHLAEALRQTHPSGAPLALALCDIDRFKQVNDRHGHAAGDRVLAAVGQILREGAGEGGFVARYGGEEFVLVFTAVPVNEAARRIEAMRSLQAARRLVNRESGAPFGRITFSAGMAVLSAGEEGEAALSRADAALYRAKDQGRNRLVVA